MNPALIESAAIVAADLGTVVDPGTGTTTDTVDLTAAGYTASDSVTETFNIPTTATLAAIIDQFDTTADKLSFGTGITSADISIDNTADDGTAVLSYSPDAGTTVIDVTLTGLTSAEDLSLTTSAGVDAILA